MKILNCLFLGGRRKEDFILGRKKRLPIKQVFCWPPVIWVLVLSIACLSTVGCLEALTPGMFAWRVKLALSGFLQSPGNPGATRVGPVLKGSCDTVRKPGFSSEYMFLQHYSDSPHAKDAGLHLRGPCADAREVGTRIPAGNIIYTLPVAAQSLESSHRLHAALLQIQWPERGYHILTLGSMYIP